MKRLAGFLVAVLVPAAPVASVRAAASAEAPSASGAHEAVQRVEIVGGSYFFRPSHVAVRRGVPVELSVRVEPSIVPHSFVLEAPQAGISIDAELSQEPSIFRFVPQAAGRFPFYCDHRLLLFKSHRERGMEGVLEVTE